MHIYQAGYFYLGIFIAGSGAVLFCSSVVAMLTVYPKSRE